MKAYPVYKESGVEWVGKIPADWGCVKLKYKAAVQTSNIDKKEHENAVKAKIIHYNDVVKNIYIFDDYKFDYGYCSEAQFEAFKLRKGDIVITKDSMDVRNIADICLVQSELNDVVFGYHLSKISIYDSSVIPKYLFYFFSQSQVKDYFLINSTGVTIIGLGKTTIENIHVVLPSLHEQRAIADFLECKTIQIDALIKKRQRQIDLLREQRTALINHTITKGLNPDVPMKDSGVEWYGEIPQHWELKRLGRITSVIMDIDHKMPLAVEEGIPFLSAKDLLNDGTLNFDNDVKKISEEDFRKLSRKVQPKRHDIIYSRIGARLGKARLVETDQRFLVSYSCCVVRVLEELALPEYICFIMDSEILLTEAKARTVGIGVPDLGLGEIAKLPIPLPPKPEQKAILDFLKRKDSKIKSGIKDITNQIVLLNEYRMALISEAVTGKIDVR